MDIKKTRGPNITQDDFDKAIKILLDAGEEPRVTKVQKITRGSFGTVGDFFEAWKKEQKASSIKVVGIPLFVQEASEQIGLKWWASVQDDVANRIQQAHDDANEKIEEYRSERTEFLISTDEYRQALEDEKEARKEEVISLNKTNEKSLVVKQKELTTSEAALAVEVEKITSKDEMIAERNFSLNQLKLDANEYKEAMKKQIELFENTVTNNQSELKELKAITRQQINDMKSETRDQVKEVKADAVAAKKELLETNKKVEEGLNQLLAEKEKLMSEKDREIADISGKLTAKDVIVFGLESELAKKKRA